MARPDLKTIIANFFNRQTLSLILKNPERAFFIKLVPLVKHPFLYSKTINVKGLISIETGVELYEAVL